jgi:hypothetical protein
MNDYPVYWMTQAVGLNPTDRKIHAFEKLKPGWRLGGGKSFSKSVINTALAINKKAVDSGFLKTDAFPGRNGDVSLVLYDGEDSYEFSISNASIEFTHEKSNGEDKEKPALTFQDSIELIPKLKEEKWNTFSIYTSAIMTGSAEGLGQRLSLNQATEAVFRSSPVNVFWPQLETFVPMQRGITQISHTRPQCFGNSGRLKYLKDASWSLRRVLPEMIVM